MTIGEVAARCDLPTSTIRYYEKIGLLPRAPRKSGRRVYDEATVQRLGMITIATHAGFTLKETKTLLGAMGDKGRPAERLQRLARKKVPELEATLARAEILLKLMKAASHCRCPTLARCAELAHQRGLMPRSAKRA